MSNPQAPIRLAPPRLGWGAHSKLAAPLAAQQVGLQLMGLTDVAMLGHYSDDALAGAGVANALIFAITCVAMGVIMGLDSIVPKAIGEGDLAGANRVMAAALRLCVIIGLGTMCLVLATPLLFAVMDIAADVEQAATVFIFARLLGIVPILFAVALRSYLSALGRTTILLTATTIGTFANAGLDYVFIFGWPRLGIPEFGVLGAALATSAVQLGTCIVLWRAAARHWRLAGPATHHAHTRPAPAREDMKQVVHYGAPVGLHMLAEVGIFALAGMLAATISRDASAAHNVALTIASLSFSLALGIGSATSIQVGYAVGLRDATGVARAGKIGLSLGAAAMGSAALLFITWPGPIVGLFTNSAAVRQIGAPLLTIAAVFQLSDGAQAILAGALRGLGDNRATFIANVIGHYGIGLGLAIALTYLLDFGVQGLWWGLSAGLTTTAIVLFVRFRAKAAALKSQSFSSC